MILPVLFQKCTHDWQVTLFCCKNSPYKEPKDFNDFQFYYFPFKPEKKMKKNKKKQIKTYAFFFLNNSRIYCGAERTEVCAYGTRNILT